MPIAGAYITDVEVTKCIKKHKNYVYAINTTWSDGSKFELYRKYGHFFAFQDTLLSLFPKEAGKFDPSQRTIPYLPTIDNVFKLFGRTNSESVMQSRLATIDYYCKTVLLRIGEELGRSPHVLNFFHPTLNDKQEKQLDRPASLHPMKIPSGNIWEDCILLADFTADVGKAQQLSAKAGETVTVMKKDESGWSLCSKSDNKVGWIPTSFLTKKDDEAELGSLVIKNIESQVTPSGGLNGASLPANDESLQSYLAICEYDASGDNGQVSFPEGAIITVIDKDDDGWWFVEYNGKEGWAPSSYLELPNKDQDVPSDELDEVLTQNDSVHDVIEYETFYAKRDYQSELEDELSFPKGAIMKVSNKSISGWWTALYNGKIGVVPATYLTDKQLLPGNGSAIEPTPGQSVDFKRIGSSKFDRPPPRRKTVRRTVMAKRKLQIEPIREDEEKEIET